MSQLICLQLLEIHCKILPHRQFTNVARARDCLPRTCKRENKCCKTGPSLIMHKCCKTGPSLITRPHFVSTNLICLFIPLDTVEEHHKVMITLSSTGTCFSNDACCTEVDLSALDILHKSY
jgi:hypothetical protein